MLSCVYAHPGNKFINHDICFHLMYGTQGNQKSQRPITTTSPSRRNNFIIFSRQELKAVGCLAKENNLPVPEFIQRFLNFSFTLRTPA